jgi:hypothetical protein
MVDGDGRKTLFALPVATSNPGDRRGAV